MSTGVTIAVMIVVAITAGLWLAIMTWPVWVIVNVTTRDRSWDARVGTGTAVMSIATMFLGDGGRVDRRDAA